MNNKTLQEDLKQQIYNILYAKSRIDGVRVLYEDEWPIDDLLSLFSSELERVCKEIIGAKGTQLRQAQIDRLNQYLQREKPGGTE